MSTARRKRLDAALANTSQIAHPGVLLGRYLGEPASTDEHSENRTALLRIARESLPRTHTLYAAAFSQRLQWLEDLTAAGGVVMADSDLPRGPLVATFTLTTPPGGRLIMGLGTASPTETGVTLHHAFGVPLIPGSALKGLAAHYCTQALGAADGTLRRGYLARMENERGDVFEESGAHRVIFGDSEAGGFFSFLDAWMMPDSLLAPDEGLVQDVITPHHMDYYAGSRYKCHVQTSPLNGVPVPPTDFDNPTPVPFLSVRGSFHFALCCADASPVGAGWLSWTAGLLQAALADWGIGGKTSSGYGRLVVPKLLRSDADELHPTAESQKTGPGMLKTGQRVDAELLLERTKKGGWRAKIIGTEHMGPIVNSGQVPSDWKVGEVHPLTIHSSGFKETTFKYVAGTPTSRG